MNKVKKFFGKVVTSAKEIPAAVRGRAGKEPVFALALVASVLLAAGGIIIDAETLYVVLTALVPLVTAKRQRDQVVPLPRAENAELHAYDAGVKTGQARVVDVSNTNVLP